MLSGFHILIIPVHSVAEPLLLRAAHLGDLEAQEHSQLDDPWAWLDGGQVPHQLPKVHISHIPLLYTFENLALSNMIGNFIKILHLTVGQYQQEGGGVGGGHPGYGDHHGCRLRPTRGLSLYMDSGFLTGS